MTTKYKTEGCVIDYTAGSNLASGAVVVVGTKVGVALSSIASGAQGSVQIAGVFTLAKATGAISQCASVYWDSTNSNITTTASGNTLAGVAYAAAANGATTVDVLLNGVSC